MPRGEPLRQDMMYSERAEEAMSPEDVDELAQDEGEAQTTLAAEEETVLDELERRREDDEDEA